MIPSNWDDLTRAAHDRAFSTALATPPPLLAALREILRKAAEE